MPIHFSCRTCKAPLIVPDNLAGQKTICSKCGQRLAVPTSEPILDALPADRSSAPIPTVSAVAPPPQSPFSAWLIAAAVGSANFFAFFVVALVFPWFVLFLCLAAAGVGAYGLLAPRLHPTFLFLFPTNRRPRAAILLSAGLVLGAVCLIVISNNPRRPRPTPNLPRRSAGHTSPLTPVSSVRPSNC